MKYFEFKLFVVFIKMHLALAVYCQPCEVDSLIFKIYNLEFNEIPCRIEALRNSSLELAPFLETDYLWWKMIANQNIATETEFLSGLRNFKVQDDGTNNAMFSNLFYYLYFIRYENLKQKYFVKYYTTIKFHLLLNQVRNHQINWPNSLIQSLFQLVDLSDEYMKNRLLQDNGLNSKEKEQKSINILARLELISNIEYGSFEIIKQYNLAKIYFEVEKDYFKAMTKFEKLSNLCPGNSIFKDYLIECQKITSNCPFNS
jgi:hypothetical protein